MKNLFLPVLILLVKIGVGQITDKSIRDFNKLFNQEARFTENKGQVIDQNGGQRPDILFTGKLNNLVYHLRKGGVSYQLYKNSEQKLECENTFIDNPKKSAGLEIYRVDINWLNTNSDFNIRTEGERSGYNNYYLSNCPEGALFVKTFSSVLYQNIYDGIDIRWYEMDGKFEYDFLIDRAIDYKKIQLQIEGADEITIGEEGELIINTPFGIIVENAPIAFQGDVQVDAHWVIKRNKIFFKVDLIDPTQQLRIDPVVSVLNWGTYFGGLGEETVNDIELDNSGNIYLTGETNSTSLIATSGTHQSIYNGTIFRFNAFLVKFNSSGNRIWGTYFGGGGITGEEGTAVTIDKSFAVYMAGITSSSSNISTTGSHQPVLGNVALGKQDAFLTKFNPNGTLQWSTYYGGEDTDGAIDCFLDFASNIYLVGSTKSDSAIASSGSYQMNRGGQNDAFIVKFNSSGVRQWGTYYGGLMDDNFMKGGVDQNGDIILVGNTDSQGSVLSTVGTHQSFSNGPNEVFISKFNTGGNRIWSTYFGGLKSDYVFDLSIDLNSNIIIAGNTYSNSNIATIGTHQSTFIGPSTDSYLAKFNTNGILQWATYYGGNSSNPTGACSSDSKGNVFLTGTTSSAFGIATPNNHQTMYGGGTNDAYVVKFDSTGTRVWGTYYGGTMDEFRVWIKVKNDSTVILAGRTRSPNQIATSGGYQSSLLGVYDTYLAELAECKTNLDSITVFSCYNYLSPSGKHQWDSTGLYLDTLQNTTGCDSVVFVDLTIEGFEIDSVVNGSLCDSGSTTLYASSQGGTIQWYENIVGGVSIDTGASFNTPFLFSSKTFYVSVSDSNNCISPRIPVDAIAKQTPKVDSIFSGSICDSGTVILKAIPNIGTINWYESPNSTIVLSNDTIFYTPQLINSKTYYITVSDSFCTSNRYGVNAIIRKSSFASIVDTSCKTYLSPSGNFTYTTSGIYMDTILNESKCDSVLLLDLNIVNPNTAITRLEHKLLARAYPADYQWVDCQNNYTPIPGEVFQSFTPTEQGIFAVLITQNNCTDISLCYEFNWVGKNNLRRKEEISIYPNPTRDLVRIKLSEPIIKMIVYNNQGQVVIEKKNVGSNTTLDFSKIAAGIYFLEGSTESEFFREKVIIAR